MLDLARLERLRLVRRPLSQRFFGRLLGLNYGFLPGIPIRLENDERVPDTPVVYAMNHTDRYNYFPFQYAIWKRFDRFTATWVKGKYYENPLMAAFMESMAQLPTVSRGYLITRDFVAVMKRLPTDEEYAALRTAVDACAHGDPYSVPEPPGVPEALLRTQRNPLGLAFAGAATEADDANDYAQYICQLFRAMMVRFTALNEEAVRIGLDLLIFPQGTRSKRLLPGRAGIAQIALKLRLPIVPVGCNGSDIVYPGSSPFGKKGRIVYRIGEPIPYEELSEFHIAEDFAPFTAAAERDHALAFAGVADRVTDRINDLLDPEYQRSEEVDGGLATGAARFV